MGFTALCYYFSITGLLAGTAFGAYYVYDREKAKAAAFSALWASVRAYSALGYYTDIIIEHLLDQEDDEDELPAPAKDGKPAPPSSYTLLYYDGEKGITYSTDDFRAENLAKIDDTEMLLIFREKKGETTTYKRLGSTKEVNNQEFEAEADKQFLQIELNESGITTEIHEHMQGFYIHGNKLLDRVFLGWYMDFWYDHELKPNYTLQIFDKDVNMLCLGPEDSVTITKDGYETSDTK